MERDDGMDQTCHPYAIQYRIFGKRQLLQGTLEDVCNDYCVAALEATPYHERTFSSDTHTHLPNIG